MKYLIMKAVLVGILGVTVLSGCGGGLFGDCVDTVEAEALSPDGRYVATVFARNCGATTDYSTHVSLREADDSFDPRTQARVLTLAGKAKVDLEWSTETTLSISLPAAEALTKVKTWRDVRIHYR